MANHRVMLVDGKKKCSRCDELLPADCFPVNKNTYSGLESHCKKCERERGRKKHKGPSERSRLYCIEWRKNNKEQVLVLGRNARARRKNAEGSHTKDDIAYLLVMQKGRCAVCKCVVDKFHVDHINPLALGGSNWKDNLQILCPLCNISKNATDPIEFMQSRGFLL